MWLQVVRGGAAPYRRFCKSNENSIVQPRTRWSRSLFPAHAGLFRRFFSDSCTAWGFPAHAGLFQKPLGMRQLPRSFPRVRGVVPALRVVSRGNCWFSPLRRGCSLRLRTSERVRAVFPAHAGLFRLPESCLDPHFRFPRARGVFPAGLFPGAVTGACRRWHQTVPALHAVTVARYVLIHVALACTNTAAATTDATYAPTPT